MGDHNVWLGSQLINKMEEFKYLESIVSWENSGGCS